MVKRLEVGIELSPITCSGSADPGDLHLGVAAPGVEVALLQAGLPVANASREEGRLERFFQQQGDRTP